MKYGWKVGSNIKSHLPRKLAKIKDNSSEDMKILRVTTTNITFHDETFTSIIEKPRSNNLERAIY